MSRENEEGAWGHDPEKCEAVFRKDHAQKIKAPFLL
jgi:hypothetical protein